MKYTAIITFFVVFACFFQAKPYKNLGVLDILPAFPLYSPHTLFILSESFSDTFCFFPIGTRVQYVILLNLLEKTESSVNKSQVLLKLVPNSLKSIFFESVTFRGNLSFS